MKRIISILILILFVAPVFAGGVGETITGALAGGAGGAIAGATLFAINPILGALGLALGAGLGMYGGAKAAEASSKSTQAQLESIQLHTNEMYQDQYVAAKQNYDSLYTNYDDAVIGAQQMQANISAYDQALMRWDDQYNIGLNQLQQQGEADYRQVMSNFAAQSNINSMTGQSGGTADLLAKQQRDQVVSLVGDDLRLDPVGGTYGTALREYDLDKKAEFEELVDNRAIAETALGKYTRETEKLKANLAESKQILKDSAGKYFEEGDENISPYMNAIKDDEVRDVPNYKSNEDVNKKIEEIRKKRKYSK